MVNWNCRTMEPQNSWTYLLPAGEVSVIVRVRLEKAYNRLISSAVDSSAKAPAKDSVKAGISSVDAEEYTFRWLEEKSLQNLDEVPGTSTEAGKEVSQELTNRLFSTVHAAHREDARAIGCCKPRRIRQIQRRNDGREPCRSSGQIAPSFRDLSAMQSPVVEMPVSVALCKNNLPGRSSVQKMCIMAYLGDLKTKSYDKRDEVVLCTLELIDDRYLRVTPDFNDQVEEPYLIYGRTGTYYYTVQDVSEVIEKHDEPEGAKAKVDLSRSSELRLSYDFDIPVEGCLRIFLLGEIESAVNFEYSNLFIAYCLEIPKGWSCQTEKRFGVTQLSSATYVQNAGMVSYFAMPLEFELMLDLEHYKVSDEHPEWPLLFIAVMSMDNLSRYRLEGYGYAELPRAPGREQYVVKTWRPIEQGVENLQRFFLGGSTQLESITLCRYVKSLKDDHVRKKIDFKTVSGGDVRINFYSIHQCREFAGCCKRSFIRYGSLPHGLRPSTGWNSSILQVLEAFQRARQKMITARQRVVREWHLRLSKL